MGAGLSTKAGRYKNGKGNAETMERQELHDGRKDGLQPLASLDLRHVETFADLLRAMARTAFGGRQLGEAHEILRTMWQDPDCHVVLTLSGADDGGQTGAARL